MTCPPNDAQRLWLKQVPNNRIMDDGVWAQSLLDKHHTKRRAPEPDHGDMAVCSCGFRGRFDSAPGDKAVFDDSIWVNGEGGDSECVECVFK